MLDCYSIIPAHLKDETRKEVSERSQMPSRVSANFIRAKLIPSPATSAATMVAVSHVIMLSACVRYTLFGVV